jgi:hypothetical protein
VVASDVYGTASAFYLLGIGGMLADSLISEAKENLKHRRPLKVGQVYANLLVSSKTAFVFGLIVVQTVRVQADVVEFDLGVADSPSAHEENSVGPRPPEPARRARGN